MKISIAEDESAPLVKVTEEAGNTSILFGKGKPSQSKSLLPTTPCLETAV